MYATICRCCGGNISAEVKMVNPNVCADCERWLEDETPREAATKLLVIESLTPAVMPDLSIELMEEEGAYAAVPAQG
jgi:hypothetical protein